MANLQVAQQQVVRSNFGFSDENVALIKNQIAKDATDDELAFYLYTARRTGLDPLAKQIYFRKQWNKKRNCNDLIFITAIDGYRLIAARTGLYAGCDDAVHDDEDNPQKSTVTVYKLVGGIRCPFTASARWKQFYPGKDQGFMWDKMPHHMLDKCAEALALRKAFPNELSGLYIQEEMDQAIQVDMPSVQSSPTEQLNKLLQETKAAPAQQAEPGEHEPDFFEEDTPPEKQDLSAGNYVIGFGKQYLGKTIAEVGVPKLIDYVAYFEKQARDKKQPEDPRLIDLRRHLKAYATGKHVSQVVG